MAVYRSEKGKDKILFANDEDKLIMVDTGADTTARILYCDGDIELLHLAENEALLRGKTNIVYEFGSRYSEDRDFFADQGYEISEKMKILSVNLSDIFESKGVQKSMKIKFPGTEYVPFRELMLYQLEELEALFTSAHIPLTMEDIVGFDYDLSGIVYDENMKIMSLVCSAVQGREIIIECLYGTKKADPRFIMSALQGFAGQLIFCNLMDIYNTITVIEANPTVGMLLRRLIDSRFIIRQDGRAVEAKKTIAAGYDNLTASVAEADHLKAAAFDVSLEKKLKYRYYQHNINWKTGWTI